MTNNFLYHAIYKNEELFLEKGDSNKQYEIYSVTKSIVSLLLGLWFKKNPQHNIQSKIFPTLGLKEDLSYWGKINLFDLLTHRSGIKWRELGLSWFQREFFKHLEIYIADISWEKSHQNIVVGGQGIKAKPYILAKIGHLILNQGIHKTRTLVPAPWIDFMLTAKHKGYVNYGKYALQWWIPSENYVSAIGYGGQN